MGNPTTYTKLMATVSKSQERSMGHAKDAALHAERHEAELDAKRASEAATRHAAANQS
jgi:hypothetical protein